VGTLIQEEIRGFLPPEGVGSLLANGVFTWSELYAAAAFVRCIPRGTRSRVADSGDGTLELENTG
jgi:hypothetical protein